MDKFLMDGHKMYWHLDRVNAWMNGERIAPLTIDVGLGKGCNIHCEYCFGSMQGNDYAQGAKNYLPREALINYVKDAGKLGVRSMALIGESEPTLNPHLYEAIVEGKRAGVDMSLGTNGILYDTGADGEEALKYLTWIRFNISAASKEAYKRIHNSTQFDKVMEKISFCVDTKHKHNLPITIGLQMVLTPTNVDQVVDLAKLGRDLGVDYLVVKQCSDAKENTLGIYSQLDKYKSFEDTLKEAEKVSTDKYNVIIKWNHATNEGKRSYCVCYGAPFLLYSSGDGGIYPCGMFFSYKSDEYLMGDITKQSFFDIVHSERYWEVVEKVKQINVADCYSNCKTHAINEFLYMLKNPPEHINFV